MSLRNDIHTAFDEVSPSTLGMPERIIDAVIVEIPRRRQANRWHVRLREPMALVAALLLIVMVVGLLAGGRLWQGWTGVHHSTPPRDYRHRLAALEQRPLNLPVLRAGDKCPAGPRGGPMYPHDTSRPETGPVQRRVLDEITTSWGLYYDDSIFTDVHLKGLILIRGRDLRTNQTLIFTGPYAAGQVVGTDIVNGKTVQQRPELVLDMSRPPDTPSIPGEYTWRFLTGAPSDSSGCVGFQIDGENFTTTLVGTSWAEYLNSLASS